MDTELRKRLEEAAENYPLQSQIKTFIVGGEWMFKEAIALAKEWWWENIDALFGHKITKDEFDNLISDFEADMNKLWEDQK